MRKWFVALIVAIWLGGSTGCEQSSAPADGGPAVRQPPGAPSEGPEIQKPLKTRKSKP